MVHRLMHDLRTVLEPLKAALSCGRAALEGTLDGGLSDKRRTVDCVKPLQRLSGIYQIPNKIV